MQLEVQGLSVASEKELQRAIQRLVDISDKSAFDVLKQQGRLFCTDLVIITRRTGKGAGPKKEQKESIRKMIDYIYWPVGKAVNALKDQHGDKTAKGFQRLMRQRRYSSAAAMLQRLLAGSVRFSVGSFDGGKLHRKYRFKRKASEILIVTDRASITQYRRAELQKIYFAKGGFATAAKQLGGTRGIPAAATNHNAPGRGRAIKTQRGPIVSIENRVKHIEHAFDHKLESIALNFRKRKIESNIKFIMRGRQRKASQALK